MAFAILAAFPNESTASQAKFLLEPEIPANVMAVTGANYGINAEWTNYGMSKGSRMEAMSVDTWLLQVLPEDYEKALAIIKEGEKSLGEIYIVQKPKQTRMLLCPKCHNYSVAPKEISTFYLILCIILFGLPTWFSSPQYECTKCGYRFKKKNN